MKTTLCKLALCVSSVLASCERQEANWSPRDGDRIGVVEIRFDGATDIDPVHVANFLKLTDGSSYTAEAVDDDIRALYESGLVDDVRVLAEPADGALRLIYAVTPRPPFGPPFCIGNTAFWDKRLAEASGLSENESITIESLEIARDRIRTFYADRGYPDAEVVCRSWEGGKASVDDYIFVVVEGHLAPQPANETE
ncbi:POTRA domain-containing protein [Haloferula chungangensis]|uniref:POTRA domain-containing protein n=1 Tax=Haloferula chungangensis TaxID=1048331 RepID=A0ABW2L9C2_9BACT